MYKVQPKGINIKDNDRNVSDGFLQESINLQWRDGSYRPIPDRLDSGVPDFIQFDVNPPIPIVRIIAHKVSDEDVINILGFTELGYLYLMGNIVNGVYIKLGGLIPILITDFPKVTDFDSLSFTILNGIIYFMSVSQEFYYKVQFNETSEEYEVKDMYAWKELIPFYPRLSGSNYSTTFDRDGDDFILVARCGIVLIRFTLVLNTGEEVLHSPIYASAMFSINTFTTALEKGDLLTNIHTIVNTNLEFENISLFEENISAINIYASVPSYKTVLGKRVVGSGIGDTAIFYDDESIIGDIQRLSEEQFYLVKTINSPSVNFTDQVLLLYVGEFDTNLYNLGDATTKINTNTIAAGNVMPVDNFTYHKIFGEITSNNGRLIVSVPKTVLTNGHIRALSLGNDPSRIGYYISTEDGDLSGVGFDIDKELLVNGNISARGVLSYPDSRATYVGGNEIATNNVNLFKTRANKSHNLSCVFDIKDVSGFTQGVSIDVVNDEFTAIIVPQVTVVYGTPDITEASVIGLESLYYTSGNRIQFSESGEFSECPAINSYRVGEGGIIFTGSNSIDPANSDYISPLLIGTSDGIYTANFDPTGVNLIQSITKAANLPALSDKNILIDQNLIYISDKGLIVINNGRVINITKDYFPEQGNGSFPVNETVYPNYNLLTSEFFGGANPYILTDIVDYMKEALFAYDGRRNNVWCSNPNKNFSLIYNFETKQWTMSTSVFSEVIDFNGILDTINGDIYSRYLVRNDAGSSIDILSGENLSNPVNTHLLTRPIKIQTTEQYKKIQRLMSRCELYRANSSGSFSFGVWGKQDINKEKVNIPLAAYKDNSSEAFPNDLRQNIPVGRMKGKYKTISILQGGNLLPNSSLDNFEIVAIAVENNILR